MQEDTAMLMGIFYIIFIVFVIRAVINAFSRGRRRRTAKIRVCQQCGMTIPYGAKKCPYCHGNPGFDYMSEIQTGKWFIKDVARLTFWSFVFMVALVVVLMLSGM